MKGQSPVAGKRGGGPSREKEQNFKRGENGHNQKRTGAQRKRESGV